MSIETTEIDENPVNTERTNLVLSVRFKDAQKTDKKRIEDYLQYRVNSGLSKDKAQALIDLLDAVEGSPFVFFKTR
jgi:hypothetical protein